MDNVKSNHILLEKADAFAVVVLSTIKLNSSVALFVFINTVIPTVTFNVWVDDSGYCPNVLKNED